MANERERSKQYKHRNTNTRFTTSEWLKDLQEEHKRQYARKPTQAELLDKYVLKEHQRVFGTIDTKEE